MIHFDSNGLIESLELGGHKFLFNGRGPKIFGLSGNNISATVDIADFDEYVVLNLTLTNNTEIEIFPERVGIYLGVDCYMDKFPEWNKKMFPTFLRCEETHFYGYFMSPDNDILGIACPEALPSYNILYNKGGHRIDSVELDIINQEAHLPRCGRCIKSIKPNSTIERKIYLFSARKLSDFENDANKYTGAFGARAEKYTVEFGERVIIYADDGVHIDIFTPSSKRIDNYSIADEYGVYTVRCTKNKKSRELKIYCRREWGFYLKSAAFQALEIPQKATTHCESWYGLFSGYLAAKHYPDEERDRLIEEKFNEIMPYMFDFENGKPIVSPYRVQNVSILISLLTDRYESNPGKYINSLETAGKFADYLMSCQKEDGGYYQKDKIHFTSVIYSAKSMLEFALAEFKTDCFAKEAVLHFNSAKAAVDNLVDLLDDIETEGEMTFEDGMISCSALQIAMFALLVDDNKKYIDAAEYMMRKHMCLEQKNIPDCRMRGGSLRFWESQYDVLTTPNMMSSPHGWTAWTLYGKYYLYLLTGKEEYLRELMDGLGSCSQLVTSDGKLRWGFISDPCIRANVFVKDKKLRNGYSGRYEPQILGECYLDMISDWYRQEEQIPTGGHLCSMLTTCEYSKKVDNQGGCCDNDVHEIFKCIEETVLKKAFLHECDDGAFLCYTCGIDDETIYFTDDVDVLVYCVRSRKTVMLNNKPVILEDGGVNMHYINHKKLLFKYYV